MESRLRGEVAEMESRLRGEVVGRQSELNQTVTQLREELTERQADLKVELAALKREVHAAKDDVRDIKLTLEHEIRPHIKLLAENYMPAAQRYVAASREIETMQAEIDVLKLVAARHSRQLAELAR